MTVDQILGIVTSKKRPPVAAKWQEVYDIMAVHTHGAIPEKIFKQRRPLEMQNEFVKKYRKENYRAITVDEFNKAINDYLEVSMNLDVTVNYPNDDLKTYESSVKIQDGLKQISLRQWILGRVGAYRQTDPNAMVVQIPKHPTTTFVPRYDADLPNFDDVRTKQVDISYHLVPSFDIMSVGYDHIVFKGGNFTYNKEGKAKPYYFAITKEQTWLVFPFESSEQGTQNIKYQAYPWYKNDIDELPAVVIGDILVTQLVEDGSLQQYYVSDYTGAAAWGDKALGQDGDLQICENRFTYPRHWRIKVKCDNHAGGCTMHESTGKYMIVDEQGQQKICPRCNGTGNIVDTTPMGTFLVDPKGSLFTEGKFQEPEGFISPPSEILQHSADRVAYYFDKMQGALCIFSQNMTNQSGESKSYDLIHKVSMNTRIVMGNFNTYASVLAITDKFRGGDGNVTITFPEDLDVKNANDILYEITEAKKSNLPYVVLVELTKKYLLKKFGKSKLNEKLFNFLSRYDKLFSFGLDDLQKAKSVLGGDITVKDIYIHSNGYQLMLDLLKTNEGLLDKKYEDIVSVVDLYVDKFTTSNTNVI